MTNELRVIFSLLYSFIIVISALSLDDERRAVSQTICAYIHKINYGKNFEQQLNFYVESRANFTNLDLVITDLVQVAIRFVILLVCNISRLY